MSEPEIGNSDEKGVKRDIDQLWMGLFLVFLFALLMCLMNQWRISKNVEIHDKVMKVIIKLHGLPIE